LQGDAIDTMNDDACLADNTAANTALDKAIRVCMLYFLSLPASFLFSLKGTGMMTINGIPLAYRNLQQLKK
jgi:hypothetical protein